MRTVIPFAEMRNFDPETTHLMGTAFENAWGSLTATGDQLTAPLMAIYSRELLARRIIELAQRGERNPIRLSDDALDYLKEKPAGAQRVDHG